MAWDKTQPDNDELKKDVPALLRANWEAIELGTDSALQITNAKVAADAGIVDTKFAQIATAGKVSGTAITGLASVPSGAGALPIANGGTGQSTRQAALNAIMGTSNQGDISYFNGTNWVNLGAGTSGQFLKSQGAGANPVWANASDLATSRVRAYKTSSTQTIPTVTWTKVTLTAETFDVGSEWDTTNSKFVAAQTGYYLIVGAIRYNSPVADKRYRAQLYKNGANLYPEFVAHASLSDDLTVPIFDIVPLTAGDYIELYTYHEAGGDETIYYGEGVTFLAITKLF